MKRRKKKWPKGMKPKLHHGGVLNESQKLCIDDVIPKIERRAEFTTKAGGCEMIHIICEGNIKAGAGGEMSADLCIHPGDDALVGETVIAVVSMLMIRCSWT
jgi:hypothetical protein